MTSNEQERTVSTWSSEQRGKQAISAPRPHDGLRRALQGSFGSVPSMPEEFTRLLDKLR